jgi:hypothetical protein
MTLSNSRKDEVRIGQMVLSEDDLKFQVEYNGEVFTLRYPSPFVKAAIEADISRKLGGFARNTFPESHLTMVEATAYVDALVVREESPDWFVSAWTCYDEECIGALFQGYFRFRREFQERIKNPGPEGVGEGGKP